MTRVTLTLILLTLVAPVTLAAAPHTELPEPPTGPAMPDLRPIAAAIANGASTAADATGDALAAVGHALSAVAAGIGQAVAAIGKGIAAFASAIGRGLAAGLAAVGGALAAIGSFLGAALGRGARFTAAHPKESAIVAGSAMSLGSLTYAAKKWWLSLFVPLYSRLAKSDMLENHVRASVFEHVKANPGVHPSAIADALGLGWGTVVYHLARLEESSLITPRAAHNRKCFFVVGGELSPDERTTVAAMATDKARLIVDALRTQPGMSQKTLAETLGMSQALTSWHVKRLVASGVLLSARDGRSNLLSVAEHVPVMGTPVAPALAA